MIKRLSVLLLASAFIFIAFAQNKDMVKSKSVIIDLPSNTNLNSVVPESVTADGDYIEVTLMANAFGAASNSLNPLAYDPYSNVVSLVYRSHSSYTSGGSGELWYSISTDAGATWTRVSAINGSASQRYARYPSMSISNPTKGDITATTGVFAWAELIDPTTGFGWVGYGADQPLGTGIGFSDIEEGTGNYSSDDPTWASADTPWMFWVSRNLEAPRDLTLFRTNDFVTVEVIAPPQWSDTAFASNGQYTLGGCSYNGVEYFAAIGSFSQTPIDLSGWPIAYSKSMDNGLTWSDFIIPDFRTIPSLSSFHEVFDFDSADGTTVQYDGDIQVDKNGYVHLVTALTDTLTWTHAIVDIFETESGWDGEVIFSGLDIKTYGAGPGLGQSGPSPCVAMDSSHEVIGVQWINKSPNTQWADIYFSHKRLGGTWSEPINLTMSDSINNTSAHLAPMMMDNGNGNYTAFSAYCYVTGVTGPFSDTTLTTSFYVAPVPFVEPFVGVDETPATINTFELEQNYPNPFNPSTKIKYSIAERSNVSIKVFDVLGKEVVTLINSVKESGAHEVNFDGSNLSSGLYIYTINTGSFQASRKMLLLK